MRGIRACPVCPECGSKKFKKLESEGRNVTVQCLNCARKMKI